LTGPTHVVVGGYGYIGSWLVEALTRRGVRVVVVLRRPRPPPQNLAQRRVKAFVDPDARNAEDLLSEVDAETVYYLPGSPGGRKSRMWRLHYHLPRAYARAASRVGARLVYVSSIAVTADFSVDTDTAGRIVEEVTHLSGRDPSSACSIHSMTKAELEKHLVSGGEEVPRKWAIIRPGLVSGGGNPHPEWRLIRLLAKLRVTLDSKYLPLIGVERLASLLADAGTGAYDGLWVNAVDTGLRLAQAVAYEGGCPPGSKCLRLNIDRLAGLARVSPRQCKPRLAYCILRRRRGFASRYLEK